MFGLKLSNDIQVNIGDMEDVALDKINRFIEANKGKFWAEYEELDDKLLSTEIVIYSKGTSTPYEEARFIINDEIVSFIGAESDSTKFVINDEELTAKEACKKYKKQYKAKVFCEEFNTEMAEEIAIIDCKQAKHNESCSSCYKSKNADRGIYFEDEGIIIGITTLNHKNQLLGRNKYGHPIYANIEYFFNGMSMQCYDWDKEDAEKYQDKKHNRLMLWANNKSLWDKEHANIEDVTDFWKEFDTLS